MVEKLAEVLAGAVTRRELYTIVFLLASALATWERFVVARFSDGMRDQREELRAHSTEMNSTDRELSARITRMNQRMDDVVRGGAQN